MSALRRAASGDIDAIATLEAQCFGADAGRFSRRQLRRLLANPNAYWLLRGDGLAMACWLRAGNRHARWARLYSLAVHPSLRGQGIAAALLQAGFRWMAEQGLTRCSAEVKHDNAAARALYARFGFTETAALRDYYAPGHDGVRLVSYPTAAGTLETDTEETRRPAPQVCAA